MFPGNYEGGRDQHLGNHYHAPVYMISSITDKPADSIAESGNSKKPHPRLNDEEKKQPSFEGMLSRRTVTILQGLTIAESRESLRSLDSYQREDNITDGLEGTCGWIFSSHECQQWKRDGGVLLIRGNPGCGKSTLLKHALTRERHDNPLPESLTMSFFFDESRVETHNSIVSLLRSLLGQLVDQDESVRPTFHETYCKQLARHDTKSSLSVWNHNVLEQTFKGLLWNSARRHMVKVFIDAIDECHERDRDDVIRFLHSLKIPKLMPSHNFALFLTSRYHPDGQISFDQRIDLEQRTQDDIRTYIETMLRLPAAIGTRRMVTEELQKGADGSFLWLSLLLPRINVLSGQGSTQKEMLREIEQCPLTLDKLYEGLLDQISRNDLPEAGRLFQWICHGKRRLKVSELRTALAIHATSVEQSLSDYLDEKNPDYIPDDETMIKRVRYLSQGLVNKVDAANDEDFLGFHHTSITQFMLGTGLDIVARKVSDLGGVFDKDRSCFANVCIRFLSTRDI